MSVNFDQFNFARAILRVVVGCAAVALPGVAGEKPRSLYDGASVMFEQAQLIKPKESTKLGLATTLAPLIVQEVGASNSPVVPARIYFHASTVQLKARQHDQMTYWWAYDLATGTAERGAPIRRGPEVRPRKSAGAETGAPIQGVRITLGTNGAPAIYEIIGHAGSIEQIYVAHSLETAALAEFGAALPGRRHGVERSLMDAPRMVVPRVIDEPPVVMGPILYLRSGTHEVATLICRCMDSQAKSLVNQGFYELVPAGFSGKVPAATRLEAAVPRGLPKDFLNQTDRLSRSLRLPSGF